MFRYFLGKTVLCHKSLSRAMIHEKEWRITQLHPPNRARAISSAFELSATFSGRWRNRTHRATKLHTWFTVRPLSIRDNLPKGEGTWRISDVGSYPHTKEKSPSPKIGGWKTVLRGLEPRTRTPISPTLPIELQNRFSISSVGVWTRTKCLRALALPIELRNYVSLSHITNFIPHGKLNTVRNLLRRWWLPVIVVSGNVSGLLATGYCRYEESNPVWDMETVVFTNHPKHT